MYLLAIVPLLSVSSRIKEERASLPNSERLQPRRLATSLRDSCCSGCNLIKMLLLSVATASLLMDTHLVRPRIRCQGVCGATLTSVKFFGTMLKDARIRKGVSQEEMANALGMTRGNYGHMESGRRKEVLSPEQAVLVARRLDIDMLDLVVAMGYPVRVPGLENDREARLVREFRRLSPDAQRFLLRGLGIET